MRQTRSNQIVGLDGLEEFDNELDFEHSMVKNLFDIARISSDKENYQDAKLRLQAAVATMRDLPPDTPRSYDFLELQYLLSVATFYTTECKNAQSILTDFVRQHATADGQSLYVAHA